MLSRLVLFCSACLLIFAGMPAFAKTAPPRQLTVFAAASLKESLDAVSSEWTKRSGQKIVVSYAASSALAKQIEQQAPADVFISADSEWMNYLQDRKLIDVGSRFDMVGNRLVMIAPATSSLHSVSLKRPDALLQALGKDGRLAVAETESVPAGRYAKQSLMKLGLWDGVSAKLAQAENVRAAMAFVAHDEAPLGIVYATDAQAEPKVRVVATFPDSSHDPIIYPAARVVAADAVSTKDFLDFLHGGQARKIFKRFGFRIP
jgi:molybdate transport system substrate-binding protein